jgi:hypothetical protein
MRCPLGGTGSSLYQAVAIGLLTLAACAQEFALSRGIKHSGLERPVLSGTEMAIARQRLEKEVIQLQGSSRWSLE